MKPVNSGTAPMCRIDAPGYTHDPVAVLNSSISVPVTWNSTITSASRRVSRPLASSTIWIATAIKVTKS